ncbi:FecR domain-containing protein [Azospirillum sp. TSA2s]|uniref:FecR family protein n=1 Tax=Azospirillum sp. TSA2s TaxID=709810 RepID=UPI00145B2B16|nr:FecR domain-containing protein [Azospirillum sp. TSA2s]
MLDDDQRQIKAEATEWVVRLCGRPLDAGQKKAFDRWLARSPVHHHMFERASALWQDLGQLRDCAALPIPAMASAYSHSRRARGRRSAWGHITALAASLLIICGLGGLWFGNPLPTLMADHATAPGELRMVTMPDGSIAELGPASAIVVRFTAEERRIELLSGLVHLSVVPKAKAEGRPFVVEAANGSAEALGTRFTVERGPDSVNVTVTEHDVRVAVAGSADRPGGTLVLSPGQTVHYDAKRGLGTVDVTDLETADAWLHGRLGIVT